LNTRWVVATVTRAGWCCSQSVKHRRRESDTWRGNSRRSYCPRTFPRCRRRSAPQTPFRCRCRTTRVAAVYKRTGPCPCRSCICNTLLPAAFNTYSDKPKLHYADFHRNFPAGKVVDINHESRGHRQSRHVAMFATESAINSFVSLKWNLVRYNAQEKSVTKSATSSRRSRGLVADTNHESRRKNLSRTLSQSWRNAIWAISDFWLGFETNVLVK